MEAAKGMEVELLPLEVETNFESDSNNKSHSIVVITI